MATLLNNGSEMLNSGDSFATYALLRFAPSPATFAAFTFCTVMTLSKVDFEYALSKFPHLRSVCSVGRSELFSV